MLKLDISEEVAWRCSAKQLFWKKLQIFQEKIRWSLFLSKLQIKAAFHQLLLYIFCHPKWLRQFFVYSFDHLGHINCIRFLNVSASSRYSLIMLIGREQYYIKRCTKFYLRYTNVSTRNPKTFECIPLFFTASLERG